MEQLISLRAIPGLLVFRPADANEVAETWRIVAALRHEPAALILSRQALPTLDRTKFAPASGLARGGYVLAEGRSLNRPTWCRDGGSPTSSCWQRVRKSTWRWPPARNCRPTASAPGS